LQLSDYILQVQELVHDTAAVDFTIAEMTAFVNDARKRAALDLACVRQLFQGASVIPTQEQYPIFNAVCGVDIITGGTGYVDTAPPVVTIQPPTGIGGVQATGVAISSGGVLQSVQMTNWGTGYLTVPTVTIAAPVSGTTATAIALGTANVFDIASIALLNGNLRYSLSWLPFSAFQAFCRAYTTQQRAPAVWTNYDGATNVANATTGQASPGTFFVFPIPDQSYPIDIDACLLPNNLINTTDNDSQVLLPNADVVQYYAAYKALLKLQNFDQADYYHKAYEKRVAAMVSTRQGRRVISQYRNWYRRMARL
jgi:hypothetical protein